MKLFGKLLILWDLFANWLQDTQLGALLSKPSILTGEANSPVEIHDNHIHIQAQTNRKRPVSLVLDTGADYNALNVNLGDQLGIKN